MKYLIGKKVEMSQAFKADGSVVPMTWIAVNPCTVAAVREEGGRRLAVIGSGTPKNPTKPETKQFGALGPFALVRSVVIREGEAPEVGQTITANDFAPGEFVTVVGKTKGRGFQGVVKRHGFHGAPATHGHKDQLRKSGSIGAGGIQRVFKGRRMAGRMGGTQVTVKNLEVVAIDADRNMIGIKGAVPGARGGVLSIRLTNGNVWQK